MTFSGTLGSLGPCAEILKQGTKKHLGPRFFGASHFLGDLGSLGARTGALFGPRAETGNKKIEKT